MTKEDKELLLKDLSARLPYGVICDCLHDYHATASAVDAIDLTVYYYYCDEWESIEHCKPYLRPLSSMTEEEKSEFINCAGYEVEESVNGRHYEYYLKDFVGTQEEPIANVDAIDWLNSHHFDYRGLIEKGLALEALEGMYNINRK